MFPARASRQRRAATGRQSNGKKLSKPVWSPEGNMTIIWTPDGSIYLVMNNRLGVPLGKLRVHVKPSGVNHSACDEGGPVT